MTKPDTIDAMPSVEAAHERNITDERDESRVSVSDDLWQALLEPFISRLTWIAGALYTIGIGRRSADSVDARNRQ